MRFDPLLHQGRAEFREELLGVFWKWTKTNINKILNCHCIDFYKAVITAIYKFLNCFYAEPVSITEGFKPVTDTLFGLSLAGRVVAF